MGSRSPAWEIEGSVVTMSMMASAVKTDVLAVRSGKRADAINITDRVQQVVRESGIETGLCQIYVPHTTAGVFINENADPDALSDILQRLEALVPWENGYRHAEGNAAAHIKATLVGSSQSVPVRNGRLALGRWQGIYFADFDGPRERHFQAPVLHEKTGPEAAFWVPGGPLFFLGNNPDLGLSAVAIRYSS